VERKGTAGNARPHSLRISGARKSMVAVAGKGDASVPLCPVPTEFDRATKCEKSARVGVVNTHQTVALEIVRRPKATPVHELGRYMPCRNCSRLQGRPYKRSHLVALRPTMISADDPPSTWRPGER
jgi:hypothetical protein